MLKKYGRRNPNRGYGSHFSWWLESDELMLPEYKSYGNGSAMRVGTIPAYFFDVSDVIRYSVYSAYPTHSHLDGIKGAVVAAVIVWMCLQGVGKEDILKYIQKQYPPRKDYPGKVNGYTSLEELQSGIKDDMVHAVVNNTLHAGETVCEAVINLVNSTSFESCLRNAQTYLCDRDTVGAISGAMAAAYYGVARGETLTVDDREIEDVMQGYTKTLRHHDVV